MAEINLPDLLARVRLDTTDLDRGEQRVGKFGGAIQVAVGTLAAQGISRAADALGSFAVGSVTAASDVGESINAVNVAYGDQADAVLALSRAASTNLGATQADFNASAVRFSSFAQTIAGESGDVVGTLDSITTRATDFASVFNLDVAQAQQVFQSGLAGETEPLRQFGIDLSAAAVEAYAYAEGIAAAGEPLTEAQKIQARYGLLLEETANTQGDFANTSGGLANQQRILSAQFGNLQATLGQAFLPAVTAVVTAINDRAIPVLERWVPKIAEVGGVIGTALGGAGALIQPVVDAFSSGEVAGGRFGSIFGVLQAQIAGAAPIVGLLGSSLASLGQTLVTAFVAALPSIQSIGSSLLSVVGAIVTSVIPVVLSLAAVFIGQVVPTVQALVRVFVGSVLPVLATVARTIAGTLVPIIGTLARVFVRNVVPALSSFLGSVRKAITGAQPFITFIGRLIAIQVQVAGVILRTVIPPILRFAGPVIGAIVRAIGGVISAFGRFLGSIGRVGNSILDAAENPQRFAAAITREFGRAVTFVSGIPGRIRSALGSLGSLLTRSGGQLIDGLVSGIQNAAGRAADAARRVVDSAISAARNALGIASPSRVFRTIGQQTGEGLVLGVEDEAAAARSAFAALATPPGAAVRAATAGGALTGPGGGAAAPATVEVVVRLEDGPLADMIDARVEANERTTVRLIRARRPR